MEIIAGMAGAGAAGDGVALGVEAGAWNARRSVGARRASLGVTRLLYGRNGFSPSETSPSPPASE